MKSGRLAVLAVPIDGSREWRGRPIFGRTKTWRGPVAVGLGAGLVYAVQREVLHAWPAAAALEYADYSRLPGIWFGVLAGGVAELFELPNSFVKRRLGIGPSETAARAPLSQLFFLWDQLDVLIGYWVVFAFVLPPSPSRVAISALIVAFVHPGLSWLGYRLGMRKSAR
jgi:hypothetical protein